MVGSVKYYSILTILAMLIVGTSFSLQVTNTSWNGTTVVNSTVCHDFGIINNGNSSISVSLQATGEIQGFTLFNTTTLNINSNSTGYFKACFTPTQYGTFQGSININNSGSISPILISIKSITKEQQQSNSGQCGLLPSVSQYNTRLSQGTNTSFVVHIKNTCSQPITSISTTIQSAKPTFAYVTGNIPGQLDPGQTLDITVNVDGSQESEGQHNFYLTVSGFLGNNRTSTNVNFNVYVLSGGSLLGVGPIGNPSVTIPSEGYVNQTFQVAVTGVSPSDLVFVNIQPTTFELKSVDNGNGYYKANYVFDKDGQYSIIVRVYHSGALYYQTSKNVIIHPPSTSQSTQSAGTQSIAKILWLVRSKIEVHQPIHVEVRTEGGDPVDKAWVKITLPDGNFLSGDTGPDGTIDFQPQQYGYSDGFPEGTASITVRKTGFADDPTSPTTIQLYRNRIPAQLIAPQSIFVGEQAQFKLINKNTGEVINYNGIGKINGPNDTSTTINFKNGYASFTPTYNGSYSLSVAQNDIITSTSLTFIAKEKPIVVQKKSWYEENENTLLAIGGILLFIIVAFKLSKGRRRRSKPTFRYAGIGKVGSISSSVSPRLNGEESNVVEVIGDNK